MLCEFSYYDKDSKLCCNSEKKLLEDDYFKERCPLIYYCTVNRRFENTTDFFGCKYREVEDDRPGE